MTAPLSTASPEFKQNRGLGRAYRAFFNSWRGLLLAFKHESAFRQELVLGLLVLPWAFVLPFRWVEQVLLIGSLLMVLVVELLNSAIEAVVDRISFEHHELSGRAKDYGSAAVLLTITCAVAIWVGLCGPHLRAWFAAW
jgi:diacylglycerol kinase (ATP)